MAHGDNPEILPLHKKLNELCHLDKTRLTTMACISKLPTSSPLTSVTDVVSYNHYFGWYGGNIQDNGKWFDDFHKEHPDTTIGMSEYGCENALWHSSHPEPGDYSNEYQMRYHEEMIDQLFSRKYLFATHVWNMFDFAADMRAARKDETTRGLLHLTAIRKKTCSLLIRQGFQAKRSCTFAARSFITVTESKQNSSFIPT